MERTDTEKAQSSETSILTNKNKGRKRGKGSKSQRSNRLQGKSVAEVNLIHERWGDPATDSADATTSQDASIDPSKLRVGELEDGDVSTSAQQNHDLDKFWEREFVRDIVNARQFISQRDDQLFAAARSASLGGAGSLAVLLNTLDTQVRLHNIHD